jgi:hypothetical protein
MQINSFRLQRKISPRNALENNSSKAKQPHRGQISLGQGKFKFNSPVKTINATGIHLRNPSGDSIDRHKF